MYMKNRTVPATFNLPLWGSTTLKTSERHTIEFVISNREEVLFGIGPNVYQQTIQGFVPGVASKERTITFSLSKQTPSIKRQNVWP